MTIKKFILDNNINISIHTLVKRVTCDIIIIEKEIKDFNSHSRKESDCTIVRFLDILLQQIYN